MRPEREGAPEQEKLDQQADADGCTSVTSGEPHPSIFGRRIHHPKAAGMTAFKIDQTMCLRGASGAEAAGMRKRAQGAQTAGVLPEEAQKASMWVLSTS